MAIMLALVASASATDTNAIATVKDESVFTLPSAADFGQLVHDSAVERLGTIAVTQQAESFYLQVESNKLDGKLANTGHSLTNAMTFQAKPGADWVPYTPVTTTPITITNWNAPGAYTIPVAFDQTGSWYDTPSWHRQSIYDDINLHDKLLVESSSSDGIIAKFAY